MNKTLHVQVHSLKFLKGLDEAKSQNGTRVLSRRSLSGRCC